MAATDSDHDMLAAVAIVLTVVWCVEWRAAILCRIQTGASDVHEKE